MLLGPVTKDMLPPLILDGATVQRVTSFQLLGVHVSNDLKWAQYINTISSKATSRLYLSVPLLYHSMGQIIKSVFLSVYVCMLSLIHI